MSSCGQEARTRKLREFGPHSFDWFQLMPGRSDAQIAGQATGAMSWAFISALKKNPQQSYVQLLNSIRDELASKYTQKPQLSCSHPLSKSILFSNVLFSDGCADYRPCRYEPIVRNVV